MRATCEKRQKDGSWESETVGSDSGNKALYFYYTTPLFITRNIWFRSAHPSLSIFKEPIPTSAFSSFRAFFPSSSSPEHSAIIIVSRAFMSQKSSVFRGVFVSSVLPFACVQ